MYGGYSEVYDIQGSIYFTNNQKHIHIDRGQKNISIVYNYFMSENEKRLIGTHIG